MDTPKIQGSKQSCIRQLEHLARKNNVNYVVVFGNGKEITIKSPKTTHTTQYLYFLWRYEYNEYDNSL